MKKITKECNSYDEAFIVSVKAIKKVYLLYKTDFNKLSIAFDDFKQECALYFYKSLKAKLNPFNAVNLSFKAYYYIAKNLIHKECNHYNNINKFLKDKLNNQKQNTETLENIYNLSDENFEICQMLLEGYSLQEVAKALNKKPMTLQNSNIKKIRKTLADFYEITDYKSKHRNFKIDIDKIKYGKNHPASKPVCAYKTLEYINPVLRYESGRLAEKDFNSGIWASIKHGWKCGGYYWQYAKTN